VEPHVIYPISSGVLKSSRAGAFGAFCHDGVTGRAQVKLKQQLVFIGIETLFDEFPDFRRVEFEVYVAFSRILPINMRVHIVKDHDRVVVQIGPPATSRTILFQRGVFVQAIDQQNVDTVL
jgi:hypothetical protein